MIETCGQFPMYLVLKLDVPAKADRAGGRRIRGYLFLDAAREVLAVLVVGKARYGYPRLMVAGAGANREERNRPHAVECSFSEVVELYKCRRIAHRPDHEIAPCPRPSNYISGFAQEIAFLLFFSEVNNRG